MIPHHGLLSLVSRRVRGGGKRGGGGGGGAIVFSPAIFIILGVFCQLTNYDQNVATYFAKL